MFLRPSLYHRGCLEYHTPFGEVRLQTASHSKVITHGGHHSFTARTGMDAGTSMETTAAAPYLGGTITALAVTNQRDCSYGITVTAFF